ncbi:amidase domain-containing protein [Kineosporia sp. J2-2]|uniref:Amidase domain-containing protein n=1 Tax=Kineosporia corallincola TaxID=2835133 RepID=A0ABS5TKP2_9ACTN|nr:amidase domain-containing protein [Kineosporia corallincola]MBT0770154.1 amidase domain-containing protein [Kineosporia corallincola]
MLEKPGTSGATPVSFRVAAEAPDLKVATALGNPIAEAIAADGDDVTGVTVDTDLVKTRTTESGSVVATVEMSTEVEVADDGSGSAGTQSWSDAHEITLTDSGNGLTVTKDVVQAVEEVDDGSDEAAGEVTQPASTKTARASSGSQTDASGQLSQAAVAAATKGYPTQTRISPAKFRSYALTWTGSPHDGDAKKYFNSKYPFYNNNCANFASQVLDNAGWYLTGGSSLQVKNSTKWTYNLAGVAHATRTWSRARDLYTFANNTGTYGYLSNIWNATTGDLLFADWDPGNKADGAIDHVMVVSGRTTTGVPRISQKSSNRNNVTLTTSIRLAQQQGKTKIVWYGLKHK